MIATGEVDEGEEIGDGVGAAFGGDYVVFAGDEAGFDDGGEGFVELID